MTLGDVTKVLEATCGKELMLSWVQVEGECKIRLLLCLYSRIYPVTAWERVRACIGADSPEDTCDGIKVLLLINSCWYLLLNDWDFKAIPEKLEQVSGRCAVIEAVRRGSWRGCEYVHTPEQLSHTSQGSLSTELSQIITGLLGELFSYSSCHHLVNSYKPASAGHTGR